MHEIVDQPPPVPVHTASEPIALEFSARRSAFVRLVARGALLELCTLGFYRFWLTTDMRRHLWSHTSAGGDSIEYTGTAKELLIGFLVAMAVLVPIYLVYFLIGIESERMQAFASIPLILFFYVFAQFAIYRARRYRMTRTIWRGVRFWMTGSGWVYALRASLLGLCVILTLGLALPWYQAALERYKMHHSHYGDLQGRFEGTGSDYFKQGWWLWFGAMFVLVLFVACTATRHHALGVLIVIAAIIAWPFAFAAFKAIEWRWWASGIRFGEVRFESNLKNNALVGLYWCVIGWSALILVLVSLWIGAVIGLAFTIHRPETFSEEAMQLLFQGPDVLVGIVLGYIIAALAVGTVVRIYLRHDLWARIVASTAVFNLAAADNVVARGQAAGSLGEGLADSLDVGGF